MKHILIFVIILFSVKVKAQITVGQIYDYNVGDIFQRIATPYSSTPPTYITDTVISKTILTDTVNYIFHQYNYQLPNCQSCNPTISRNTYSVSYPHTTSVFTYTNASNCPSTITPSTKDTLIVNGFCSKKTYQANWIGQVPSGYVSQCSMVSAYFSEGLGQTYYHLNTWSSTLEYIFEMVYYNKGGITCGTFYSVGIKENENELLSLVKLYPNPTEHLLTVDLTRVYALEYEIKIIDISGKSVYDSPSKISINKIDVSNIDTGLYIVEITTDKNKTVRFKFIKN